MKSGAAIRVWKLRLAGRPGPGSLKTMELHGRRLDKTSARRAINEVEPLVFRGLNLSELYLEHAKNARIKDGTKNPIMHFILQWPTSIEMSYTNELAILEESARFINDICGGRAVFAGRLDRDEIGRHAVDIFAAPLYTKTTKLHGVQTWSSTSKHLKILCKKHEAEIRRRFGVDHLVDNLQAQGMALQSEWIQFLEDFGLKIKPKVEKNSFFIDYLPPDAYAEATNLHRPTKQGLYQNQDESGYTISPP